MSTDQPAPTNGGQPVPPAAGPGAPPDQPGPWAPAGSAPAQPSLPSYSAAAPTAGVASPPPGHPQPYPSGPPRPYPSGHPQPYPGQPTTAYPQVPPYGATPPPGYGPYGPPGYGPGGYGPGYAAPPKQDGFAVAGFILSLLGGSVLAIIFGIMGIRRTRDGRAKGRGMAIAAVVIGPIWLVLQIVGAVYALKAGPASTYAVGDCVRISADGGELDDGTAPTLPEVACSTSHGGEVYAAKDLPGDSYPGVEEIETTADAFCAAEFERFVGLPVEQSELTYYYLYPRGVGWRAGDHEVVCLVISPVDVTGTLRGAAS